jgi:ketosteroid isomerase-like protein
MTPNEEAALLFAEAITRGDIDAALAVCHPDIEFRSVLGISGRAYLGHDGIREYFEDVESAWEEWSVEVERTTEAEDGRVVIVMTMHARGKGSGVGVAERTAHIWTLEDGKLAGNRPYRAPERALLELGLKPGGPPGLQ